MKLEWAAVAVEDRNGIFDYIEARSSQGAVLVDERIRDEVRRLLQFPDAGRPGRIEDTRELVISNTPFIVVYRLIGDTVRVLRVLHGARQWPDALSDV